MISGKLNIMVLLLSGIGAFTANAQRLQLKTYVENTHISPKAGVMIGFENKYAWEYGTFYQESGILTGSSSESSLPKNYERTLYGAFFAVPLVDTRKLDVKMQVRTGVSNGVNFVITPSAHAYYSLVRNVKFGVGLGTRAFRPTLQSSFVISM